MKILVLAAALDLSHPLGCTPAWWQLLKALNERGAEVVATPYYGRPVATLWWRSYENPGYRLGQLYAGLTRYPRRRRSLQRGFLRHEAEMRLARRLIAPRWTRHLTRIIESEQDVSAVVIFSAPPNHLAGVGAAIRARFGIPVCYYDADLPTSLARYGGFDSGVDRYRGAHLEEYDMVLSNSQGVLDELRQMGARRADVLWFAADPEVFRPMEKDEDIDVFFYGHGVDQREEHLRRLITIPSERLPQRRFVVAGTHLAMDFGRAEQLAAISPSELRNCIARSRIQVNVSRSAHATVYASANTRLFELAAMEEAIVTNPLHGIEEWFRPGSELEVVDTAEEAISTYEDLLANPERRRALAVAARRKVLNEHTFRHRASRLLGLLESAGASTSR